MDYSIIDNRSVEVIKEILTFAKTFIFKDQDQADSFESTTSILWGSYFTSACDGTLPYLEKYGKRGFANAQLQDYNVIPNGVEYFQQIYLINSLYIGSSAKRLKEVREATPYTNADQPDPPFVGNVFEANTYYRLLFCQHQEILPNIARMTPDHGILYYEGEFYYKYNDDGTVVTNKETGEPQKFYYKIDTTKFLRLYADNRNLFVAAMENRAMRWDSKYKTFVNWMIVVMTIFSYLDSDLEKIYRTDLFDQYDIRNALYSFGITFLDDLPETYQKRVIKNLRELVRTKSTDNTLKLIIKDIFGRNLVDAYKLYLVYADTDTLFLGTNDIPEGGSTTSSKSLFFVKIPFDVTNPKEYLVHHPEIEKLEFDNVVGDDPTWDTTEAGYHQVVEKLVNDFGDGTIIIPSKYIGISNDVNVQEHNDGAVLLFSLLHYIDPNAVKIPSIPELHVGNVPLFYAFLGLYYLGTAINNLSLGDMDPDWATQPSIKNILCADDDSSWHFLSFITELSNEIEMEKGFRSVFFSLLNAGNRSTLYSEMKYVVDNYRSISDATSLADVLKSLFRVYRETRKLLFFASDAQDAVGSKFVKDKAFVQSAIANGLQAKTKVNSGASELNLVGLSLQNGTFPTVTEDVFRDNALPYPFEGQIDLWGDDSYSKEIGFTEFTEYKLLRGIYEKVLLSKENYLPSNVYFGAETAKYTLAARVPALWQVISKAIEDGLNEARSTFTYLASAIVEYVQDGGLPEGLVSFNSFSKGYLAEYASKLVEKFVSYTVQLQVSGAKLSANGSSDSYVGVFDRLNKSGQHLIIGDSFYGLADRDQGKPDDPTGEDGESRQITPESLPSSLGSVPAEYIPMNDELVGFKMFQQITYHPDRYGVVANDFGIKTVINELGEDYSATHPVWKWDSFKTNDVVIAHIVNRGSLTGT